MRLVPRRWSTETWACSMKGHVAPAATVRYLSEDDELFGFKVADGRICRCLRCDAWINYDPPTDEEITSEHLPPAAELPKPKRGKALDERVVVRLIALERGLHVLFFVLLILLLTAVALGLPWIHEQAQHMLANWKDVVSDSRPGSSILVEGLTKLTNLDRGHIGVLIAIAAGYALLEGVEAFYLWRGKRWAEYLTVLATAILLPPVIQALVEKVTIPRLISLAIELAILIYLVWTKRLFGLRGGQRKLDEMFAADVDWDEIYAHPPRRPVPVGKQVHQDSS